MFSSYANIIMKVAVVILAILVEALASPLPEAPLVVDSILESTTPLPVALPISNLPSQYSNVRGLTFNRNFR